MQLETSRVAAAGAPTLVLLPGLDASGAPINGEERILGLSLPQRSVLAARRAGYGRIFFVNPERPAPAGAATISDWGGLANAPAVQGARLVIAPAAILAETEWLGRVAAMHLEPAGWSMLAGRVAVLAPAMIPDALAGLRADGGAADVRDVERRLAARFGPATPIPGDIDPLVVAKPQDVPLAEQRLLHGLVKHTDGFMARHVDRRVSLQISRRLAATDVTPTQVTMFSLAIGLCGAPFFLSAHWALQTVGALLFLLHSIVDGCDGELARLKFQESRYGGMLDFWGDNVVHVAVFGCVAVGWALSSGATWPLWLGAAATIGALGSSALVYWKQLRAKDGSGPLFTSVSAAPKGRLAVMLDAAARRDFVYLVPVLALFGKSSWLLLMAAFGAPVFFLLLIVLSLRERLQGNQLTSATELK